MKNVKCLVVVILVMFVLFSLVGCNRNGDGQDVDLLYTGELQGEHFDMFDVSQADLRALASSVIPEGYGAAVIAPPGDMLPGMIDFTQRNADNSLPRTGNFHASRAPLMNEHQYRITEEMLQATIARDNSSRMLLQFAPLVDRLRMHDAGCAAVQFYDLFYRYFPGETQYYFTFYEAVRHDERLVYISEFANHELRIIRGDPDCFRRTFIYFNPLNPNTDVFVRLINDTFIDAILQTNRIVEIADMPGYYIVINNVFDAVFGFIFMDGENYFHVIIGHSHVTIADFPSGFSQVTISSISVFSYSETIQLIRGLQFHEFIEGWGRYIA